MKRAMEGNARVLADIPVLITCALSDVQRGSKLMLRADSLLHLPAEPLCGIWFPALKPLGMQLGESRDGPAPWSSDLDPDSLGSRSGPLQKQACAVRARIWSPVVWGSQPESWF